jgi:protein TonB
MELKKSNEANLEKWRGMFFLVGLVIALCIIMAALEWKIRIKKTENIVSPDIKPSVEEKVTPVAHVPEDKPTAVTPPQIIEEVKVVNNEIKVDENITFPIENTEDNKIQPIKLIDPKTITLKNDVSARNEQVYMKVEEMPKFQGDDANTFREWIKNHTRYPQIAIENGISGRVIVQFSVNSNGEIVDIIVVRPVDPVLDKEAVRVIRSSPKWTPGKQRGKPVKVQFNFPVYFELQQLN